MQILLPKKLNTDSKIHLVPISSPVQKSDAELFADAVKRLKEAYPHTKVFDIQHKNLDPRYLAGSENERLRILKRAIREGANWLIPIYGGTGCADVVRYIRKEDLALIRKYRPIVNGFSDATFLLNFLWFKIKLVTFHFSNACGLFYYTNHEDFFDAISGKITTLSYHRPEYSWLTPNNTGPSEPIVGTAIGGNLGTFRDLLDICQIKPRSWEDYILFVEDIDLDMEDLHRIIISLYQKGVFMHVKAVVLGLMNEKSFRKSWMQLNRTFTNESMADHMFEYLISDVIEERTEDRDPLYILKVNDFGHEDPAHGAKDQMVIPIGAQTTLHPDGTIEFKGPFVE